MPAPIVVAKAALIANKEVKKRIPGGWKTVLGAILVMILIPIMLITQVIIGVLTPFSNAINYDMACETPGSGNVGTDDEHDGTENGGSNDGEGDGSKSDPSTTGGTPWPTVDSKNISWPAPNPADASGYGPRAPFMVNGQLTPGFHNGIDFGQPQGSPVLSIADGVVATTASGSSIYGSHIAVKHRINGQNYTSMYGHIIGTSISVKQGQTVKAGQRIASVGSEGMSTGAHIHMVLTQGDYSYKKSEPGYTGGAGNTIDGNVFLRSNGVKVASGGLEGGEFEGIVDDTDTSCTMSDDGMDGDGFGSWGGYENGEITSALAPIPFDKSYRLNNRASAGLDELNDDFSKEFGKDLTVLEGYLSLEDQQRLYDSGEQIVEPGKSIFGWARAVELRLSFGTPEYAWMTDNAEDFGWAQTSTYAEGGSSANAGIWGYKGSSQSSIDMPAATSESAKKSREIAKQILEDDHGWGATEYACLVNLWERESNWNYQAENPSSGAYGIVQALPPEKMNSVGSDWKTNPKTQIVWGLIYIEGRYGTPCGAWEFWQETDAGKKFGIPGNWY